MSAQAWNAVAGYSLAILGIALTIAYARRAEKLRDERKRLGWDDLLVAADDLSKDIRRDFAPDVIVTPGLTGATFAHLLSERLDDKLPVYVGIRVWKTPGTTYEAPDGYFLLETQKWYVAIPVAALAAGRKVLYVDDFVMSGDFLFELRRAFASARLEEDAFKSATIAVTDVAIKNRKAPDYWWFKAPSDEFYFPWGRAK